MEVTKCKDYLSNEESGISFIESLFLAQIVEQRTTSDVAHEIVDPILIGEHVIHRQDEGMVGLEQNILLIFGVLDLFLVDENIFVDTFHSM